MLTVQFDDAAFGFSRAQFAQALRAEGIPVGEGYVAPIYLEPIYQRLNDQGIGHYGKGVCPVTERMHEKTLLTCSLIHADMSSQDLEDVAAAVEKVSVSRLALRNHFVAEVTPNAQARIARKGSTLEPKASIAPSVCGVCALRPNIGWRNFRKKGLSDFKGQSSLTPFGTIPIIGHDMRFCGKPWAWDMREKWVS